MTEVNLKRDMFAQAIRQGQRQQKIREMRSNFNRATHFSNSHLFFNAEEFGSLKDKCRQLNYSNLQFLENKDPIMLMESEGSLDFVGEINYVLWREGRVSNWQQGICLRVKCMLKQYIQHIIQRESTADPDPNPQATLSLFTFIHQFRFYHELWPLITLSKNQALLSLSFHFFTKFVANNIECLNSQQITSITRTLSNYRDCMYESGGEDKFPQIMSLVDSLSSTFPIGPNDMLRLVDIIIFGISNCPAGDKQLIKYMSCQTKILKNFLTYMDKRNDPNYLSYDLTTEIVRLISQIFSRLDNQALRQVLLLHPQIVVLIRSWLPINRKVSIQDLEHFIKGSHREQIVLSHFGNKCTKQLIYALTNIVASGQIFIQEILTKSDIWRALIMLETVLAQQYVEEIAIVIYNTVFVSSPETIQVLIQQSLPDILLSLLRHQSSLILTKALSTIILVHSKIAESGDQTQNSTHQHQNIKSLRACAYTKQMWGSALEMRGGKSSIERLLVHQNQQIGNSSAQVFDLLF